MEDVEPALAPTKLVVAQANVEDDGLLRLGEIGNAKQILGFEIGDDDRGALAEDFLRLGDDVAVGGKQVFDQLVVLTEEGAALVVVGQGKPRALQAVVGERLVDEGKRDGLGIGLAQIMNGNGDGWWRAVGSRRRGLRRALLLRDGAERKQRKKQQES